MGPRLSKISYKMSEPQKMQGYRSENSVKAETENTSKKPNPEKNSEKPNSSTSENVLEQTESGSSSIPKIKQQRKIFTKGLPRSSKEIPVASKKKSKPSKDSLPSLDTSPDSNNKLPQTKKSKTWLFKGFSKKEIDSPELQESTLPVESTSSSSCVCTGYRRSTGSEIFDGSNTSNATASALVVVPASHVHVHVQESSRVHANAGRHCTTSLLRLFNPEDYPIEDEDEKMRRQRAKEIEEGVDLTDKLSSVSIKQGNKDNNSYHQVHTQVDFIHCLVPDLKEITSCSFYWGKIDRYEAERLLEGKPEGTFLLRDSAQEEYLFSVSFRRYGRSLHARIEQWNHRFSFDAHDPSVFSSSTVTGLLEHYKDASVCMFFEPMLTIRLHRNFTFSLQHLARSVICNHIKYDDVNQLPLPKPLKHYLKEYHYKQRVRVRTFAD